MRATDADERLRELFKAISREKKSYTEFHVAGCQAIPVKHNQPLTDQTQYHFIDVLDCENNAFNNLRGRFDDNPYHSRYN